MDWDHFRDPKTGGFRLRRLPPIKSPIRVTDVTEIRDWMADYNSLSFDEAVRQYQADFDAYEVEVSDHEETFERAPAEYLGKLALFRKDPALLWNLLWIERLDDDSEAISVSPALANRLSGEADSVLRVVKPSGDDVVRAALANYLVPELKEACSDLGLQASGRKADLIQRLVGHEAANPGAVRLLAVVPTLVMPTPALKDGLQEAYEKMIAALVSTLADYPERYRQCVLAEIAIDFETEELDIRSILSRQAGFTVPEPRTTMQSDRGRNRDSKWRKVAVLTAAVLFIWFLAR